jgi:hypothetical protein
MDDLESKKLPLFSGFMLVRDGETTRQMGKADEGAQTGGSCTTGRMGARTGKKKRKTTSTCLEARSTRLRIFGV